MTRRSRQTDAAARGADGASLPSGFPGAEQDVASGYRITGLIGRGGMGEVWEARQLTLARQVALKVIRPDIAAQPGFAERFCQEAQMAAHVEHPGLLPIYDSGRLDDGRLYLAMRLVKGTDLDSLIVERGHLTVAEAVKLLTPVAEALDAAHAGGLIHRDVKPANVLIESTSQTSRAYLTDFGLARPAATGRGHTTGGAVVGTADCMAPEQVRGDRLTPSCDIYAFGCLLHHVLTGGPPFDRTTVTATMLAQVNDPPPAASARAPWLPPAIDEVLGPCLHKDPVTRPGSATAVMAALRAAGGDSSAHAPGPKPTGTPFLRPLVLCTAAYVPLFVLAYLIGGAL